MDARETAAIAFCSTPPSISVSATPTAESIRLCAAIGSASLERLFMKARSDSIIVSPIPREIARGSSPRQF